MLWVYLCQFERLPTWKLQKTTNHFRTIWFCCVELRRLPNILVVCCFCKLVKLWPLLGLFRLQSSLFRSGRNRRFWRSSHALRGHFWPLNHTKKRKKIKRSLKRKGEKKRFSLTCLILLSAKKIIPEATCLQHLIKNRKSASFSAFWLYSSKFWSKYSTTLLLAQNSSKR